MSSVDGRPQPRRPLDGTPAEAGISPSRGDPAAWIPAAAGMTGEGVRHGTVQSAASAAAECRSSAVDPSPNVRMRRLAAERRRPLGR
jgi:hypothetical protein